MPPVRISDGRASKACEACRARKTRCYESGSLKACLRCTTLGLSCSLCPAAAEPETNSVEHSCVLAEQRISYLETAVGDLSAVVERLHRSRSPGVDGEVVQSRDNFPGFGLGNVVQKWEDLLAHHDQDHLDDGTMSYTTLQPLNPSEASSISGRIPGGEAPDGKIDSDCIKHVDPRSGKLLRYWGLIDNVLPSDFPLQPHYSREHCPLINSVSLLRDGNILASLRSVSAVIVISRETGKIIWHLDSTIIAQQHHAAELEDGSIMIFDNGVYRHHESFPYSRVIQVDRATKKIIWQYRDPHPMSFFTPFMGAAQRLQNGNTLITEAALGRVFEVTQKGKICWEYIVDDFASYKGLGAPELEGIFDYPANAVFWAYKYLPEEVPWLEKRLEQRRVAKEADGLCSVQSPFEQFSDANVASEGKLAGGPYCDASARYHLNHFVDSHREHAERRKVLTLST